MSTSRLVGQREEGDLLAAKRSPSLVVPCNKFSPSRRPHCNPGDPGEACEVSQIADTMLDAAIAATPPSTAPFSATAHDVRNISHRSEISAIGLLIECCISAVHVSKVLSSAGDVLTGSPLPEADSPQWLTDASSRNTS